MKSMQVLTMDIGKRTKRAFPCMQVLQRMNTLHRQLLGRDLSRQFTGIDEDWKNQLMAADVGPLTPGHLRRSSRRGEVHASIAPAALLEPQLSTSAPAVTPAGPASHSMVSLHAPAPDNEARAACINKEPTSGAPEDAADLTAPIHQDAPSESKHVLISWV